MIEYNITNLHWCYSSIHLIGGIIFFLHQKREQYWLIDVAGMIIMIFGSIMFWKENINFDIIIKLSTVIIITVISYGISWIIDKLLP